MTRHPSGPLGTWSRLTFSTSTDSNPKKPLESTGDGGGDGDGVPVAEVVGPTKEEPRHTHIEMPSITDVGVVCVQTGAFLPGSAWLS